MLGIQVPAPTDLPVDTRHLDCLAATVKLTDKPFGVVSIGRQRVLDGIEIAALARGVTPQDLIDAPAVYSISPANSPRRFDEEVTEGMIAMAEWGQPVMVTPFCLMGAMTPVTLAAALMQQNAEALAGIVLTQVVRPGTPVLYGPFTSNVDMKSGAPAFGTPEHIRATLASGQLARRCGVPYRSSNANASNAADAQAMMESMNSMWSAVLGGAHYILHAAGWQEGGLTASFEKFILDVEALQMMADILRPIQVDPEEMGREAIRNVPAGGHFFGESHTLARFSTAFYAPMVSDWRPYETWEETGAVTATERATKIWQKTLAEFEPPPCSPEILDAVDAYVARRK